MWRVLREAGWGPLQRVVTWTTAVVFLTWNGQARAGSVQYANEYVRPQVALDLSRGSKECPCLPLEAYNDFPRTDPPNCGGGRCYEVSYGLGECAAFSKFADAECTTVDGQPLPYAKGWCSSMWCYVDPERCEMRTAFPSDLFEGRWYSFTTCGNVDIYTAAPFIHTLRSRPIRYTIVGTSAHFVVKTDKPGGMNYHPGVFEGSVPGLFKKMVHDFDLTVEFVPLYDHNIEATTEKYSPSSYTACVHQAALNETDVCVGDYWDLEYRRILAPFTPQFAQEPMRIVTFKAQRDSFWKILRAPFRPFDWGLWVMIGVVLVLMAASMYYTESCVFPDNPFAEERENGIREMMANDTKRMKEHLKHCLNKASSLWTTREMFRRSTNLEELRATVQADQASVPPPPSEMLDPRLHALEEPSRLTFQESAYLAALSYVGAAPAYATRKGSSQVISVAFGFFILVACASFTANTASFLLRESQYRGISNIEEALRLNKLVCVDNVLEPMYEHRYGLRRADENGENGNLVINPEDTGMHMVDMMDAGECEYAIMSEIVFDRVGRGCTPDNNAHCDKVMVGDPIASLGLAWPLGPDFVEEISWAMAEYTNRGGFQVLDKEAKQMYLPPQRCNTPETDEDDLESQSLGWKDMLGTFIVTIAFTFVAVLYTCVQRMSRRMHRKRLYNQDRWHKRKTYKAARRHGQGGNEVDIDSDLCYDDSSRRSFGARTFRAGSPYLAPMPEAHEPM